MNNFLRLLLYLKYMCKQNINVFQHKNILKFLEPPLWSCSMFVLSEEGRKFDPVGSNR